jgi:hypothetical protein
MGRVKGGLFAMVLDANKRFPLDSRMLVTKREDLINPTVWITNTLTTEATYNGMIVAVNSDGEHNGVYYLTDRKAITADNYAAYKTALATGENVDKYFAMWKKLSTTDDNSSVGGLTPVDGTIVISNEGKSIGVAIAPVAGNMLTAVDGGLFVPPATVKLADNTHGLTMVDGTLTLNLATHDSDGAMSKEDKIALDTVIEDVAEIKDTIADIISGDSDADIEKLADHIQEVYDDGKMSSSQYDDLMGYIQDLM